MILSNIKRIRREDLPEAPAWIERVIAPFNIFVDSVYNAMNKNIEHGVNIRSFYKELEVSAFPVTFANELPDNPKCVILAQAYKASSPIDTIGTALAVEWDYTQDGVRIKNVYGLTAGVKYKIRLLVM